MKKNNRRHVLEFATQTAFTALMIPLIQSTGDTFPSGLKIASIIICICLLLLSVFRLLEAIALNRHIISIQEGIDSIVSGNYAIRFHTGTCPAMDEVILGINRLTALLETVRAESIRSETARKRLLSDISHDIRTPLTSIIGYIGALKDDIAMDCAERDRYIEILEAKSRALKSMVEDIFQLAKLDADEIILNPEHFDLAELVRETLIEFLPEINSAGISLVTEISERPVPIIADTISVGRIVRNLVQNALQHGANNQYLRVTVSETSATTVSLVVADRGRGIAENDIPLVFTRLYRRDVAGNKALGGSGLGLTIAQSLVNKNSATISVTSTPGGETVFKVDFRATRYDLRKN